VVSRLLLIRKFQRAERFGKNAILRGLNFQEGATAKERNKQDRSHNIFYHTVCTLIFLSDRLSPIKTSLLSKKSLKLMKIRLTTFSEAGVRRENEDFCQVVSAPDEGRYLFVVCDGMGGHAMGEVASRVVCEAICDYWQKVSTNGDIEAVLRDAFKEASKALDAKADALNHVEMGTTMVLAAIVDDQLFIAHAGDSRAYFIRSNDKVVYQTKDHVNHSVWGDFIDRSFFSYQQEKADVEMHHFKLQTDDKVFLCTDGVCQFIMPDLLTRCSMADKSPEDVADIIQFLCEKFSKDNYSGILIYNE
jgi:protein phosphatase